MADRQSQTAGARSNTGMDTSQVETVGNAVTQPSADRFGESYANPDLLNPAWSKFYQADPFQSQPANLINEEISTVAPLAAIKQPGEPITQVQNVESDLLLLRMELPFLPIVKYPRTVKTLFLGANIAGDIAIPGGAALVKFRGPLDYYVSFGGRAVVPTAASVLENPDNDSIFRPEGEWYYIGGINQISVVGPNAGTIVQATFIMRPSP